MSKLKSSEAKKKTPPVKKNKSVAKKSKQRAIGFMNASYTTNSGVEQHLRGISIFADGNYVDQKAVHLIGVAERNGGEITIPMMVTFRPNKEIVLPADEDIPVEVKDNNGLAA